MYVCFIISPVPITEPLTSELIDTPVFHNLAPRPIKYRVSVPIPTQDTALRGSYVQGDGSGGELADFHHLRSAGEEILNPATEWSV